jgi:hypothetical protein
MPLNPSTPITLNSNIWSTGIRTKLTDAMMVPINKSPTLRAQLNQLSDDITAGNANGQAIQLANPNLIPGSQYVSTTNILSIHPNDFTTLAAGTKTFSAAARFVGILVHEMGHRVDDVNLDRATSIRG